MQTPVVTLTNHLKAARRANDSTLSAIIASALAAQVRAEQQTAVADSRHWFVRLSDITR